VDRAELAAALRAWRERVAPGDVGLPAGLRRRTPGLRREEVAQLAGVSVDYLARLEQRRGPHPSDAVLAALARALRLSEAERDHLFRLAGGSPPLPGRIRSTVRPSVLRLLDRFTDLPAMLLDAKTDVLAWNAMAAALLGDYSALPAGERNVVLQAFLGAAPRTVGADDADRDRLDRALVANLRRSAGRYPDDPGIHRLIARLNARSERFAAIWSTHDVGVRREERKWVRHPQLGMLELDCDALQVIEDDQVIIVYSAAPGSREAEALDLLRVVGLQELAPR
jgi:transcriptional regulator with XRE-family HTH domain